MPSRESRLDEARALSQMLIDVAERSKADFADAVAPFGLPVQLARAVLLLTTPAPMRDLADRLACDRSYITNLADRLEERGLVSRVQGEDRRVKLLELTERGTALRDQISEAVAESALVLRKLSGPQRKALSALLHELLVEDAGPH
jgi:DNA-binding MarR family transcriptional regulator